MAFKLQVFLSSFFVYATICAAPAQPAVIVSSIPNHMLQGRWAPAFSLLPGGIRAIIVGGYDYKRRECCASADLYDSKKGRFIPSKNRMIFPRDFANAILLDNGQVLICGGYNDLIGSMRVSELYDPIKDSFSLTGSMGETRELFQAVKLASGEVLATGGLCLALHRTVASAELYDPKSGRWRFTGSLAQDRFGHAACALRDGKVLIVGGASLVLSRKNGYSKTLSSAEIYDPASGLFTPAGSMIAARDRPAAVLLPNGEALITGGQGEAGAPIHFDELYNPSTGKFRKLDTPALSARMAHNTIILQNGSVISAGGWDADAKSTTNTIMALDPGSGAVTPLQPLPWAAHDEAMLLMSNGDVVVAGGKIADSAGHASSSDTGAVIKIR
jgi:hypothetical protein